MKRFASLLIAAVSLYALPVRADDTDDAPRSATLQWTPLSMFVGAYGASLEAMAAPHHAIVVSGYYANVEAVDPQSFTLEYLPHWYTNQLTGAGGELGYRYYFEGLGPRGLFVGPSLLAGTYSVDTPRLGASSSARFFRYGVAVDVGYQAILGPIAFALGAGAQYTRPDKTVVDQSLPISVYSDAAVRPRVLASIGVAF